LSQLAAFLIRSETGGFKRGQLIFQRFFLRFKSAQCFIKRFALSGKGRFSRLLLRFQIGKLLFQKLRFCF